MWERTSSNPTSKQTLTEFLKMLMWRRSTTLFPINNCMKFTNIVNNACFGIFKNNRFKQALHQSSHVYSQSGESHTWENRIGICLFIMNLSQFLSTSLNRKRLSTSPPSSTNNLSSLMKITRPFVKTQQFPFSHLFLKVHLCRPTYTATLSFIPMKNINLIKSFLINLD